MNKDILFGFAMGFLVGMFIGTIIMIHEGAQFADDYLICQRTIQYQLDKTPEEVQTLMQTEKKREGR
jgi:hypothetical protein